MAPDATNPARGEAPGLGKLSFPGGIDNRDNSPPSLVAQIKIAPIQQDFAAGLSRATATSCILGVDPGISGAIAFCFPSGPDRVAADGMPIAAGEVDCATLAARIRQMARDLAIGERVTSTAVRNGPGGNLNLKNRSLKQCQRKLKIRPGPTPATRAL
jgi:hypothetical protein